MSQDYVNTIQIGNGEEAPIRDEAAQEKLATIEEGAQVNQNAFSNFKIGSTTIAADNTTDTFELVAGTNVTLVPNATNDSVTIATNNANLVVGTSSGDSDAVTSNNNTYLIIREGYNPISRRRIAGSGATTVSSDSSGHITINSTNTTYSAATTSAAGLMSAADKTKLNGIAAGAQVNPGNATTSAAGLMSASDKTKLNSISSNADQTGAAILYVTVTGNNPPTVYAGSDQDITVSIGKSKFLGINKLIFTNNSNSIIYGLCLVGWETSGTNLILHVYNPTSAAISAAKVTVGIACA